MSGGGLPAEEMGPRPGVPAAEALEGLPIAGAQRLEGARVSAVTATTLRAALDLLLGDHRPRRPLEVSWDDGALEVRCPVSQTEALSLAGGLMETIEGSLGPSPDSRPEWVLRVPVQGAHAMYLMLQQGTLALAVPWHSVIRVRMVPAESIAGLAYREGSSVLPPFVSIPGKPEPRPAVLIGVGLRRAYLIADRLIWRMPAESLDASPPHAGLPIGHPVRTLDGEVYWAVEPSEVLAKVEPLPLPRTPSSDRERSAPDPDPGPKSPRPPLALPRFSSPARAGEPPFHELGPGEVEPLGELPKEEVEPIQELRADEVEPVGEALPDAVEPIAELQPDAVEPLGEPTPEPERPPIPASPRPALRALIAEDSIIGRIFLERLLEQRGFAVESVGTARELQMALARESWDVVMADVDLPDAGRGEHLRRLATAGRWVALVRDRDDERVALEAGVPNSLRKPFESDHLDRLLPRLGFGGRS